MILGQLQGLGYEGGGFILGQPVVEELVELGVLDVARVASVVKFEPVVEFRIGHRFGQSARVLNAVVSCDGPDYVVVVGHVREEVVYYLPRPERPPVRGIPVLLESLDVSAGLEAAGENSFLGGLEKVNSSDLPQVHPDGIVYHFGRGRIFLQHTFRTQAVEADSWRVGTVRSVYSGEDFLRVVGVVMFAALLKAVLGGPRGAD